MIRENNKFGEGELFEDVDLKGDIYASCCACMSIYSEFLSWSNNNLIRFKNDPITSENIIVLGCQVTDLAVLNDLRVLEKLIYDYGTQKQYFVGGCLARRFDIELPKNVKRLNNLKHDYQYISYNNVKYEKPFWIENYKHSSDNLSEGNLFRNYYPLRIGVGCNGHCSYCTIKITRGKPYQLDINQNTINEFISNENVVLIADSPSKEQLSDWLEFARLCKKRISLRNVEPNVCLGVMGKIDKLISLGLIEVLHVPIQSSNTSILHDMKRDSYSVEVLLNHFRFLKRTEENFKLATNVIIDYKDFPNEDLDKLNEVFDYVSWNPYWDGIWDREKAEDRFQKYFPWSK